MSSATTPPSAPLTRSYHGASMGLPVIIWASTNFRIAVKELRLFIPSATTIVTTAFIGKPYIY